MSPNYITYKCMDAFALYKKNQSTGSIYFK